MNKTTCLTTAEAHSASAVQTAIDALGRAGGGCLELPAMELELDRGLELRSGVELVGQGEATILRHAPARVYPLASYHNYGMCDLPLEHTTGLLPGMTVAIRDTQHGGFFETLARITWVEPNWVGLDTGLHSDYYADKEPALVTAFPLIFGRGVQHVAVRSLSLDGQRARQPQGIGGCRGAALYLIHSDHFEVTDVVERDFFGEGLGFQLCSHGTIRRCRFSGNLGNGFHPGAGSTGALFEQCEAQHNGRDGFFFCVRANHITVRDGTFSENQHAGLTIGTRDCYNLIENCRMERNADAGIILRNGPRPVEVHSCIVRGCSVTENAALTGRGQIEIHGAAHDVGLINNRISGAPSRPSAGIYVAPGAQNIFLQGNEISACWPHTIALTPSLTQEEPNLACGLEALRPQHTRHLRPQQADDTNGSPAPSGSATLR